MLFMENLSSIFKKTNVLKRAIVSKCQFFRFPFLIISIFLFVSSCTGFNLRTWPIPISPNTHPSESYADGALFLKGGFFYHKDFTVLYSGTGKLLKTGRSCSQSFLYLVAIGSSRIYDAKVDGGINSVALIEEEVLGILGGFYHRHCTIVSGDSK